YRTFAVPAARDCRIGRTPRKRRIGCTHSDSWSNRCELPQLANEVLLIARGVERSKTGSKNANTDDSVGLLRARRERPRGRAAEKRDELTPFQIEHRRSLPSWCRRPVYRTLNLPRRGWQVLGIELNCSESRRALPTISHDAPKDRCTAGFQSPP